MEFIEATAFTKHLYDYLTEDEFIGFQSFLLKYPETGDLVPGSGGVRKIRWAMAAWESAAERVSSIISKSRMTKFGC